MLAAYEGHLSCVEHLVSPGAEVKTRNSAGNTALMLAKFSGRQSCLCVEYLEQM